MARGLSDALTFVGRCCGVFPRKKAAYVGLCGAGMATWVVDVSARVWAGLQPSRPKGSAVRGLAGSSLAGSAGRRCGVALELLRLGEI